MNTRKLSAYVDKYGDPNLNLDANDVSAAYVIAAVIVNADDATNLVIQLEEIRKKFFQTGEMRSKTVGKNDKRRHKILDELLPLNFRCMCLIVDKRRLTSKGFAFKRSFLKNLNGKLHSRLFRLFPGIQVTADEHGGSEFMTGFLKYVDALHQPDLFNRSGFEFANSKNSVLIQLADFIAGTVARGFDQKKLSDPKQLFIGKLRATSKLIAIEHFPPDNYNFKDTEFADDAKFDARIAELAFNSAKIYIKENEVSLDADVRARLEALDYLLAHYHYSLKNDYVETHKLMEHLIGTVGINYSQQQFRNKIIGKLRDNKVLIASSRQGYKIPCCQADLNDFVNYQNKFISPMISRLRKCYEQVFATTLGELNILSAPEHQYLQKIVEYQQAPPMSDDSKVIRLKAGNG